MVFGVFEANIFKVNINFTINHLSQASAHIAQTSAYLSQRTAHLCETSAHLSQTSAHLICLSAQVECLGVHLNLTNSSPFVFAFVLFYVVVFQGLVLFQLERRVGTEKRLYGVLCRLDDVAVLG